MSSSPPSPIKRVVVLMMENQSFDRIFGYLPGVGTLAGHPQSEPSPDGGSIQTYPFDPASPSQLYSVSPCPAHQHNDVMDQLYHPVPTPQAPDGTWATPPMTGFLFNYRYAKDPVSQGPVTQLNGKPHDLMAGFTPDQLPALSMLARTYTVCTNWFSSVPGPTGPNRLFANCASSGGFAGMAWEASTLQEVNKNSLHQPFDTLDSVFRSLADAGHTWAVYHEDSDFYPEGVLPLVQQPPAGCFNHPDVGFHQFLSDVANHNLTEYSFLTPTLNNAQHDSADARIGDQLIASLYNALYDSDYWEETLFIITYDEHGGHYDHLAPPTTISPDDYRWDQASWPGNDSSPNKNPFFIPPAFDFTLLGVRVPALIISAYTPAQVDSTLYEHSSLPATLRDLWKLPKPLSARDAAANSVLRNVTTRRPASELSRAPYADYSQPD